MMYKKCRHKRFRQDVSSHVVRRKPGDGKGTIIDVLADEVVTNVDVLGPGRNGICLGNGTCALVVAKDRKRFRVWKLCEDKEKFEPNRLFDSIGQGIIFRLSG